MLGMLEALKQLLSRARPEAAEPSAESREHSLRLAAAALLFEVSPTDLMTIGAVAVLLLGVALVACWLPGRRAARIKPLEAISTE